MGRADLPHYLSSESRELLAAASEAARQRFAPIAHEGEPGRVNRALVEALAGDGFLPRLFPSEFGGTGDGAATALTLCLLREGLARGSTEAETALALQGLGAYPILQAGSSELKRRWLPEVAGGRAVAAFALTEEEAGTDAAALRLAAERTEGGYVLTGAKKWISNAPDADVYSVFARTGEGDGARGITAFAVAGDSDGLSGEPLELLAPHAIGRLSFDDVFVPDDQILGRAGEGFRVAMRTLDLFRPSVGAFAVGMAQAALDAALDHAGSRHAFGGVLRDFQGVSHPLAEAAVRTKAARLLVYEAAIGYDSGEPATKASAMSKLYATETAQFVIDVALQVHGARGLEKGHLLEHLYRDVRATRIYEGTSEIQREIIARELYR